MREAEELVKTGILPFSSLCKLISNSDSSVDEYLKANARRVRDEVFSRSVFLRALIEISSYCKCNCYYCGLRRDNKSAKRYRLTKTEILDSVASSYSAGLKTVVLQGGEDSYLSDDFLIAIIKEILSFFDVRITLSLGERSKESYQKLYDAGARRYLLRHESITRRHYMMLHPDSQRLEKRIECLKNLKMTGYQTGCGFMVGSPYQKTEDIARDLMFIKAFGPHMVGIGPFISASGTPFDDMENGSAELTLRLLAIIRIMNPSVLLPSTTALASIKEDGEIEGLEAGANVIMPNFTPSGERKKYSIYNNKQSLDIDVLKEKLSSFNYSIDPGFGDAK